MILKYYPPLREYNWSNGHLNPKLPIVFIPLQGWQRGGIMPSDPNCGEASAFPGLFNSFEEKEVNIIYFLYGIPIKIG